MSEQAMNPAIWNAWPAIEEKPLSYGVLRFSQGYTRRANSLIVNPGCQCNYAEVVADAEKFFSERDVPVRICLSFTRSMSGLDRFLQATGYELMSPSLVMGRRIEGVTASLPDEGQVRLDAASWLAVYNSIIPLPASHRDAQRQILARIDDENCFLVIVDHQGNPAGCALGVLRGSTLCIFNVATIPARRRQGVGCRLVQGLLDWGGENKADQALLQVAQANPAAVALYRKMGFEILYRYGFRERGGIRLDPGN
ncbi:MAG: GNAT family N-acetyltransferase [Gammaproteobacteria bacterium]|nr:GNAT family N-acetyltransferase [Planctomycetaceae bacterium]MCB1670632.1 GNAT family N-acetyltransferase [Pseudomonadales bacterium]MCP5345770.1 GNAT family N-acetyltransferase [Pseudomonadales bacterium]